MIVADPSLDRLPPHDTSCEQSLLCCVLLDDAVIPLVRPLVQAADFYHPKHRVLYQAMLTVCQRGEPTDFTLVCAELERTKRMADAGGEGYVVSLLTAVPIPDLAVHYAQVVRRTAANRALITAAGTIARLAYADNPDVTSVCQQAEDALAAVRRQYLDEPVKPRVLRPVWEVYRR